MSGRARRGASSPDASNDSNEQVPAPESTETQAPEQVQAPDGTPEQLTAAPVTPGVDQSIQPTPPAQPARPIDLAPFKAAVEAAAAQADDATGILPESAFAGPNAEYGKLEGAKAKNLAKAWLAEEMQAQLMAGVDDPSKVASARAYMQVQHRLTALKTTKPAEAATPADLTTQLVSQVAALRLAEQLVKVPDEVKPDWQDQVTKTLSDLTEQVAKYRNWAEASVPEGQERPEAPGVSPIVVKAWRMANGRAPGRKATSTGGTSGTPHDGPRRSVEAHIRAAFDSKAVGTFLTISEITNHRSAEYGDDKPSSGAVSAALFGKDGTGRIKGGAKGAMSDGKRGAVKVAEDQAAAA